MCVCVYLCVCVFSRVGYDYMASHFSTDIITNDFLLFVPVTKSCAGLCNIPTFTKTTGEVVLNTKTSIFDLYKRLME